MKYLINDILVNVIYNKNKTANSTVLFLHGWGGSTTSFLGMQKALSKKYSTINLDFPGFGQSEDPPANFRIYDYSKIVIKLLQQLKIKKVFIVAHSFGGRVALVLSSTTNLVEKQVLVGAAGIKPKFSLKTYLKIKKYKTLKFLVMKKILPKKCLKNSGSSDYKALNKNMKQVFVNVVNKDLTYTLKNIKAPTLLIWGKKDELTPMFMAKIMQKNIKNSGLVVFKNAGHYCYLEEYVRVVRILENFFS